MKISNAQLQWHDDGLPSAITYDDVYFSRDDAEGESMHVFVSGNRLPERWSALAPGSTFTIAELGFGGGLNFMQTQRLWQQLSPPGCRLHYLAFELHPLTRADMERLHANWPGCQQVSEQLLRQYPDHTAGCHRLHIVAGVQLDLYYGDAAELLASTSTFAHCSIDSWFLDGFSPTRNPRLWHEQLLARIGVLSRPDTTLSSYSVAGAVRQGLAAAGFAIQKLPGFGRKREMLFATRLATSSNPAFKNSSSVQDRPTAPWLQVPAATAAPGHALIIGAGLAGCSTARSLAQRGWRVTVLERGPQPASGASGIAQMALRCRLFRQAGTEAEFFTQAFLFANRQFNSLQEETDISWRQCGVIQLLSALNRSHPLGKAELMSVYSPQILTELSRDEASHFAESELNEPGWLLPLGGWLRPASLCAAWLDHAAITLHGDTRVNAIEQVTDATWLVHTDNPQQTSLGGDILVIANAGATLDFPQCGYLPLQDVRGQITRLAASATSARLDAVINGERTIFPIDAAGAHTLAASYATEETDLKPLAADDQANLRGAAQLFSNAEDLGRAIEGSQVALRCTSRDRLPVVGRLAQRDATVSALAALGRNARHRFNPGSVQSHDLYYPGLYINVAHGSNGLATCPLSAELLASQINNENLPCTGAVAEALNPIRFLVRELRRQQISSDN